MDAQKFIHAVNTEIAREWQNSDLWSANEIIFEAIAEHIQHCASCRQEFENFMADNQQIRTLLDFEQNSDICIDEWICNERVIAEIEAQTNPNEGSQWAMGME